MSKVYTRVSRVANWAGWCSPCEREDRPLVLTRSGPGGVGAWIAGLGDDDRLLLLTCRVCGNWQFVPAREEDDPEVFLVEDDVLEAVAELVYDARSTATPVQLDIVTPPRLSTAGTQREQAGAELAASQQAGSAVSEALAAVGGTAAAAPVPAQVPAYDTAPMATAPVQAEESVDESVEALLAALGQPATARPVPSPPIPIPSFDEPSFDEPVAEVAEAVVEAPAAEASVEAPAVEQGPAVEETPVFAALAVETPTVSLPEPRAAAARIVTVPDAESVTTPAFSPEAVAAAAAVLAAARAGTPSTPERRGGPVDRRRRARSGPTPRRRADAAVLAAAAAAAGGASIELPPTVGLPAGTHQVVLAAAS